jgi:hypothetical protein
MKNIEALIDGGGDITVGPVECGAAAADGRNALAMFVRRDGETFYALLKRLSRAIAKYYETGETIDKIKPTGD